MADNLWECENESNLDENQFDAELRSEILEYLRLDDVQLAGYGLNRQQLEYKLSTLAV